MHKAIQTIMRKQPQCFCRSGLSGWQTHCSSSEVSLIGIYFLVGDPNRMSAGSAPAASFLARPMSLKLLIFVLKAHRTSAASAPSATCCAKRWSMPLSMSALTGSCLPSQMDLDV